MGALLWTLGIMVYAGGILFTFAALDNFREKHAPKTSRGAIAFLAIIWPGTAFGFLIAKVFP